MLFDILPAVSSFSCSLQVTAILAWLAYLQAMYKLLMAMGITPLDGTTNPKHMQEDLQVLTLPDLEPQELQAFSALVGGRL